MELKLNSILSAPLSRVELTKKKDHYLLDGMGRESSM